MGDETIPQRVKTCPRCGAAFDCCGGGGWCAAVSLSAAQREKLRGQYADCLCAACLKAVASESAPLPKAPLPKAPHDPNSG